MSHFPQLLLVIFALSTFFFVNQGRGSGLQRTGPLAHVRKIYVGSFGTTADAGATRDQIIEKLSHSKTFAVVSDRAKADAMLEGNAIFLTRKRPTVRVHVHGPPRSDEIVTRAQASLRIVESKGRLLWSGRVMDRWWGSQETSSNLAAQIVRQLYKLL